MTVQELINELQKLKYKDADVVVRGYEGDVDSINQIEIIKIIKNKNEETWLGKHRIVQRGLRTSKLDKIETAYHLSVGNPK